MKWNLSGFPFSHFFSITRLRSTSKGPFVRLYVNTLHSTLSNSYIDSIVVCVLCTRESASVLKQRKKRYSDRSLWASQCEIDFSRENAQLKGRWWWWVARGHFEFRSSSSKEQCMGRMEMLLGHTHHTVVIWVGTFTFCTNVLTIPTVNCISVEFATQSVSISHSISERSSTFSLVIMAWTMSEADS